MVHPVNREGRVDVPLGESFGMDFLGCLKKGPGRSKFRTQSKKDEEERLTREPLWMKPGQVFARSRDDWNHADRPAG